MSLLDDVRIVVTPNGYKAGELYAVIPVPTEGAEEVTNGDFATDSDWTKGTGWTISGGSANSDGANSFSSLSQASVLTIGKRYKLIVDINLTSGQLRIQEGGAILETYTTTGANTAIYYFIATATNITFKTSVTPFNGSIDNVSVKEYTSADMDVTRATAATRVDENGLVNYAEVIGSDLITNGDFTSNIIGWGNALISTVPDIVWNNGKARITNTTGSNYNTGLNTTNNPFNGLTGIVKVTGNIQIISGTASSFKAREHYGTVASFVLDASGDFEVVLSLNGTSDDLAIYTYTDDLVFDIDNIVAKEIQRDNVPRIDYTGGGCPHILAEPQRTNVVANSDPTSNEGAAGNIAYETFSWRLGTLIENSVYYADNTVTRFRRLGGSLVASTYYAFSFYCIKDDLSAPTFALGINDDFIVKLNGLQVSQSLDEVEIKDKGNGVYFITIASDRGTGSINVIEKTAANTSIGFRVSGFQIEAGSYSTSYIPTSGSTVTRNQDIFTRDGIGSLINSQEGVLFIEMAVLSADTINRYISLSNGTDDNSISFHFRNNANNQVRVILKSGNVNQFDSTYNPSGSTDFVKVAFKYKVNDFALWVNGTEISTDTSGITFTADTLNRLAFDDGQGGSPLFGKVKQLQVYESALTDPQLEALTK